MLLVGRTQLELFLKPSVQLNTLAVEYKICFP